MKTEAQEQFDRGYKSVRHMLIAGMVDVEYVHNWIAQNSDGLYPLIMKQRMDKMETLYGSNVDREMPILDKLFGKLGDEE